MLLSSALCATAVFAGAISGSNHPVAVIVASLWAFVGGLVVCIGTTASDLGVISTVSLLVYAAQPLTARQAAISGLLAIGGRAIADGAVDCDCGRCGATSRNAAHLAGFYQELAQITEVPAQTATVLADIGSVAARRKRRSRVWAWIRLWRECDIARC